MDLLTACQMAYKKHHLGDESIGWDELSSALLDALCNEMGDEGYQNWLESQPDNKTGAKTQLMYFGETYNLE